MTNLMQGVVQHGTAAAANALNWPLAGKTGTVDDNTDAWFVGFDPNITVGVWMGNDEKKPIGYNETGTTAALPMWMDFMKVYIELYGDRENPPKFESPGNIVFMPVDRETGEPATCRRRRRGRERSLHQRHSADQAVRLTISDFGSSGFRIIADL